METATLASLCSQISSGGTPSRKQPEYFSQSGHLWVKSQELLDRPIIDTSEKISDLGLSNSSAKYYAAQTVLIAMYGATVGQLGILGVPATVNQAICALCVDPDRADYRYVYYALMATRHDLVVQAAGAAQQNLNQGLIRAFEIPIFPLQRQHSIADILGNLDDLIENNRRRIEILEEMTRLLYREWFVHFRFPGYEDVELVDSELGPIPTDWSIETFADLVSEQRQTISPEDIPRAAPMVGLEHLPRRSTTLRRWDLALSVGSRRKIFEEGDILFSKIRPYFHKVVDAPFKGYSSTDAIVFRPRSDDLRVRALAVASSDDFVDIATVTSNGTKMPRANTDVLLSYKIPHPTASVERAFNQAVGPMDSLRKILAKQSLCLEEVRQLLLPRLMSGELDISDLDLGLKVAGM